MSPLTVETITRSVDVCDCDWCGLRLKIGATVHHHLPKGASYCSEGCAENDGCFPPRKYSEEADDDEPPAPCSELFCADEQQKFFS